MMPISDLVNLSSFLYICEKLTDLRLFFVENQNQVETEIEIPISSKKCS